MFKNKISLTFTALIVSFILWQLPVSALDPYCGDGAVNNAREECDDGNFINRDGCSNYCKMEDMTPPEIKSVSISNDAKDISTLTDKITVTFSESIDPESINDFTVKLIHDSNPLNINLKLKSNNTKLAISIKQELFSEARHALQIYRIKDIAGNVQSEKSISIFTTAKAIDRTPPNVVIDPPRGEYYAPQSISLTPYIDNYTGSDDFIDTGAVVYYTFDGSKPTTKSIKYTQPISAKERITIRYFGIDAVGNRSRVKTATYWFDCPERPNAKEVLPYPECKVQKCKYGYILTNSVCISRTDTDPNDHRHNSVTAPLFPSPKAMTISSKPAIRFNKKHKGEVRRPIVFKELKRGTIVHFEQNTKIKDEEGNLFIGYIQPPINLYSKNFPINFGYSFKSIFTFEPIDKRKLIFTPSYRITVPYTKRFKSNEGVSVFTYNPQTEQYSEYDPALVSVNKDKKEVTISANQTNTFFIAQKGRNFNRSVFKDIKNHWARNYIEALYRKGIIKGRGKGKFAPDENVIRAEFTKIVLEAIEAKVEPINEIEDSPFKDVHIYAWYLPYVKKAKDLKLIKGYKNGTFRPEEAINRAEAIKMLITAFDFDLSEYEYSKNKKREKGYIPPQRKFRDIKANAWYFPVINFAIQNQLADGIRDKNNKVTNYFGPDKPLTRGEMAKLTIKIIELHEEMNKEETDK